jgi:hypothetical protein
VLSLSRGDVIEKVSQIRNTAQGTIGENNGLKVHIILRLEGCRGIPMCIKGAQQPPQNKCSQTSLNGCANFSFDNYVVLCPNLRRLEC